MDWAGCPIPRFCFFPVPAPHTFKVKGSGFCEDSRRLHPCVDRRPAGIFPGQPAFADSPLRQRQRLFAAAAVGLCRGGGAFRAAEQQAARIFADDCCSKTEPQALRRHPGLEIFPLCPQPAGQHRLQVDAAQGAGHRRHLGQRISGRRQDGDHHRGHHRGDG